MTYAKPAQPVYFFINTFGEVEHAVYGANEYADAWRERDANVFTSQADAIAYRDSIMIGI